LDALLPQLVVEKLRERQKKSPIPRAQPDAPAF
jgi:hypothetical protein